MKTLHATTPETTAHTTKPNASHLIKGLIAGVLMTAFTTFGAKPGKAQDTIPVTPVDSTKTEKVETPKKTGAFMIDPMYSPTDKTFLTRFQGGGTIGGFQVGGFVDFSATNYEEGINTAFGKITVAKPLGKYGTSATLEYTLHTATQDKVRVGIKQVFKLQDGSIAFKVYPLGDKGFEPFLVIGADYKLGKYLGISSFVGTDIKSKVYYNETDFTVGSGKIQGIGQVRVQGTYTTKPKVSAYVGMRVKF